MNPHHITDIAGKFTGMVIPDTKIQLEIQREIKTHNKRELFFEVFNANNRKAIREGFLRIKNE